MSTTYDALATPDLRGAPCDLRVTNATKHYEGFLLDGVSLDVPRGSVVGLIGQNGAGKTTLMKSILGIVHLDAGHVELFGNRVSSLSDRELAQLKERVGYVSTVTSYPQTMTVAEVAGLYRRAYPRFDMEQFVGTAQRMGLLPAGADALRSPVARKRVKDLSRGMGMKLQFACVLASGTSVLVMDEPTAGLDPLARDELLGLIRTWMEVDGRSALISSHITSDLERLADYLVFIDDGRVLLTCDRNVLLGTGIARLRTSEIDQVLSDGFLPTGQAHLLKRELSCDLFVPDRATFRHAYPHFVCEPASLDDVMALLVKGEVR